MLTALTQFSITALHRFTSSALFSSAFTVPFTAPSALAVNVNLLSLLHDAVTPAFRWPYMPLTRFVNMLLCSSLPEAILSLSLKTALA